MATVASEFVHLHVQSWYSFLGSGSSPEALVTQAAALGHTALAITDRHGVGGAVQFAAACKRHGIKPIIGATLNVGGEPLVLLCENRHGYATLCRLLSAAHAATITDASYAAGNGKTAGQVELCRRSGLPGEFDVDDSWVEAPPGSDRPVPNLPTLPAGPHANLICLTGGSEGRLTRLVSRRRLSEARRWLEQLASSFPGAIYVELVHHGRPGDDALNRRLRELAASLKLPVVASNDVRYALPTDFPRYDALTCVRLGITVGDRHPERPVNDLAWLCPAEELAARLPYPEAFAATAEITARCEIDLLPGVVTPPTARLPDGAEPNSYLRLLCCQGLERRYATAAARERAQKQLEHELGVVIGLELSEFFLVVHEVVDFARRSGIRCAGRGSAANSIIAYLLGITTVDPLEHRLLFERFLHQGRKGMPDIDVDFDSERRPEVIAWMERRFGAEHCAMTATIQTYRIRGAMREMMKVLGFDLETVDRVGKLISRWDHLDDLRARRDELAQVTGPTPLLEVLFTLVEGVRGCPRHLGLHNGGMVLTREPLCRYSPIQTSAGGFREIQFDKDDVEALGLIKFDVLGLRTLAVLSEAVRLEKEATGRDLDLDAIPFDDGPTFDLICSSETMSVFQIESPGQMNLLSRTQPRTFRDLTAQVALFRPGPLQGGMVNPYVARRQGKQPVVVPHPVLKEVLDDTYGVILFQEQVLEICHQFAGLSLSEADRFRQLMSKWRDPGNMEKMGRSFIDGAKAHLGTTEEIAAEVFRQVAAFVGYGFCRSHAAAFARTVFQSAWLKRHRPVAYMAAVMQHQPGFFPMSTVMAEAKRMGVRFLPVDAWRSGVRYRIENGAIRLPLTQVKGLGTDAAARLVAQRPPDPLTPSKSDRPSGSATRSASDTRLNSMPSSRIQPSLTASSHRTSQLRTTRTSSGKSFDSSVSDAKEKQVLPLHSTSTGGNKPDGRPAQTQTRAGQGSTAVRGLVASLDGNVGTPLDALLAAVDLTLDEWEALARAGAFDRVLPRREALWRVGLSRRSATRSRVSELRSNVTVSPSGSSNIPSSQKTTPQTSKSPRQPTKPTQGDLFSVVPDADLVPAFAPLAAPVAVSWDYATQGLSARSHPLAFHRRHLDRQRVLPIGRLVHVANHRTVTVAGLPIVRQRPPTAKGMMFITLEDETGRVQIAIAPPVYEICRQIATRASALLITGQVQHTGKNHLGLMASTVLDLSTIIPTPIFASPHA